MSKVLSDDVKRVYVLDTNVLLHDPMAVYAFEEHRIVIPMTVLEELDRIKDSKKDVARDARVVIKTIEHLVDGASPEDVQAGILIEHKGPSPDGTLSIFADYIELNGRTGSDWMPLDSPDNFIINSALCLQRMHESQEVVLVTKDINMRIKARSAGLKHVEDYRKDKIVEDIELLSKGYQRFDGDFWQQITDVKTVVEYGRTYHDIPCQQLGDLYVNQYLLDEDSDFAARVVGRDGDHYRLLDLGKERLLHKNAWGVHAKNVYQGIALHALLDPKIDLVILNGPAGSGKTYLALASALDQSVERGIVDKVIVTRSTPEIAESIGFLPGTEEEKMLPWLGAVTDTMESLHKGDALPNESLQYIVDKANIQFKSLNFMRGRSIQHAFVLVDEAQNLTAAQLKTIITRCGEGTKLVISGNLSQIDSNYLSPVTSGLTYVIEKFKNYEGSANIYLNGVVRSRLAEFAEENM
ncbi:PhoH family protein [Vibrio sp. 10N.261.51.A3]|uniref:PhoH family protein n=1 Tax=Vibrio TaxID=662 RepID=UPI0003092E27|nr:PhoH family protein [Vibrio crassostreae]OEE88209.1 ATPase [Vibrio crassostreae 9ZC88]